MGEENKEPMSKESTPSIINTQVPKESRSLLNTLENLLNRLRPSTTTAAEKLAETQQQSKPQTGTS